jgi:capsular polysaccharide export protein
MVDLRQSSRPLSGRRRRRSRLRVDIGLRSGAPLRPRASVPNGEARGALLPVSFNRADTRLAGRRFLIVSAPFGPFGGALAKVLEARGATVERMIFNAGDAMNWRRGGGVVFKGAPDDWAARLPTIAGAYTDLIVFGEGGPYNRAVLNLATSMNARVWVLENGYFRPDWITVERDGVNGSSRLPRNSASYAAPVPAHVEPWAVGKILPHHVVNISAYHLAQGLGRPLFPQQVSHYTASPLSQCIGHIRRYVSLAFRPRETADADVIAARGDFFIVCLQREGDAQLLRYSQYPDNTAFLTAVMDSFAALAPADVRLVVKNHPLDPGLIDLSRVTRRLAETRKLQGRVDFIDGGNLAQLCRASRGMVVNNSSAALSALGFQTPVKVMGQAFFDFEGLTDQQALGDFWSAPQAPDAALFTRFRAHVIARSQVNGNFHEPHAVIPTAEGVASVFERADLDR